MSHRFWSTQTYAITQCLSLLVDNGKNTPPPPSPPHPTPTPTLTHTHTSTHTYTYTHSPTHTILLHVGTDKTMWIRCDGLRICIRYCVGTCARFSCVTVWYPDVASDRFDVGAELSIKGRCAGSRGWFSWYSFPCVKHTLWVLKFP